MLVDFIALFSYSRSIYISCSPSYRPRENHAISVLCFVLIVDYSYRIYMLAYIFLESLVMFKFQHNLFRNIFNLLT